MNRLPDEILKEILEPSLHIPNDEFSSTDSACDGGPFGRTARNSSSLLVVSKRWMRVATPLLYEVVIIRSTAQSQALAYAIKSNKAFGLFIKKLRMEGGFGKSPAQFISSAPNIRELFVTLDVWSNDSTSGLCDVLSGMKIRRLIINHQDPAITNAQSTRLWQSLSSCIPRWSNLEILEYHSSYVMTVNGKGKYMELVTLLNASPFVKHVILDWVPHRVLAAIASVTSLKTISVEALWSTTDQDISSNPRLLKLVQVRTKFADKPIADVLPFASVVAGYKPLENVPEHTAKPIWDLIFSFATHSYYFAKPPSIKPPSAPNFSREYVPHYWTAQCLSLVSKSFREIVKRHLFSIVHVESSRRFSAFSDAINDNDTTAHLVRVLRINCLRQSLGAEHDNRMTILLPKLTGLVYFDAPLFNLRQLKRLNPTATANLQTLDVRLAIHDQSERDIVELGVFAELVYFRCRFDLSGASRRCALRPPTVIVHLPHLTSFSMGLNENEDTLDAFCSVRMPSLTHLQLSGRHPKTEQFLRLNGETLNVLEISETPSSALWTWCPHLENVTVYATNQHKLASLLKPPAGGQKYSSLSKIHFTLRLFGSNIEKAMLSATEGFELIDFSHFPNLREVHIRGLTWPNTERDIKKNPRCDSFGLCLKKWGIAVYDGSGTPWRERAKVRRGR